MLLAALALLPLAGLLFYNAEAQRAQAAREAKADTLRTVLFCQDNEERMVRSADRLLVLAGEIPAVQHLDGAACGPLFTRMLGNQPGFRNFGLLNAQGRLVASARPVSLPGSAGARPFFKEAMTQGHFAASDFEMESDGSEGGMICGDPVRTPDGKLAGVVFAEMDLAWMVDLPAQLGLSPSETMGVISHDGTILMRVPDPAHWIGKSALHAAAGRFIVQQHDSGTADEEGLDQVRRLFAYAPLDPLDGATAYVSAGIPDEIAFAAARQVARRQEVLLLIFGIVALAAAWIAADLLVLRGVRRLLRATQKVAAGDLQTRAGRFRVGGELQELAQAFDTMALSLEQQNNLRNAAERELEHRVAARTAELAQVNRALQEQIAERSSIAAALQASNERLDLVLRGTNDGIWDWDIIRGEVYLSPRWKEMLGYADHEMPSAFKEWETRIHPDDRTRALATLNDCLAGKSPSFDLEHRLLHKDGSYRWIRSRGVVVRDAAGTPLRMAGSSTDLTERRVAEQALRESEEKLRAFLTNVPAILFSIDRAGIISMAEGQGMEALKLADGVIVGRSVAELYGNLPGVVESVKRALSGESFVTTMRTHELSYEVAYSPTRDSTGEVTGVIGVARDISESVRAKEALERTAAELRRSNEELEQFAYIASHDLQEPLRMVASYTQLLERRYSAQLDDAAREFIGYAVDGARRMQEFITGLLRYSRVGTEPRVLEEVPLSEVYETAIANLRVAIQESGAHVETEPLPVVRGDPRQLTQLFQNLIGNALKFRKPNQAPEIHIRATLDGGFWSISIRDNGIGLDPRFSERVFTIFQRLHTRDEYEGTGLGLAICKKIVERHGGRIWVESREGEGATFTFTLPALEGAAS
jgi:PAS domain S-box-containing protein